MKYIRFLLFLALLTISGCQNELYENAFQKKVPFETNTVSLSERPEIEDLINQNFGNIKTGKFATNKNTDENPDAVFETNSIIEVIDTLSNKNYSIRFSFDDTPENITYNLVVNILPDNTQNVFVEKYTCNPENFTAYKNSQYSFQYFKGSVALYNANAFFNKTVSTGKKTSKDPCLQLTYPNGDPVPSSISFIDGQPGTYYDPGSPAAGGSGNPYIDNGYSYGPVTWTYYPPDNSGNDSGSSSGSSGGGNGCCSCGNCGTHYYPPSDRPNHTQKGTPCDDLRPIGFITLNAEPEALRLLREKLPMTIEQWQWLHGKDHIAYSLLNYVINNPTVTNAKRNAFEIIRVSTELNIQTKSFPLQILNAMTLNPNLVFDVQASYFSPFNIDKSEITNSSPEGQKFNEIYNALTQSPEFKKLFENLFDKNKRFNAKFNIGDVKGAQGTTKADPLNPINNDITIDRNFIKNSSKLAIAKTILHECIHAFLNIKYYDPNQGTNIPNITNEDLVTLINKEYSSFNNDQAQHNFIYNNMIPTMQKILGDIKDFLVSPEESTFLESLSFHPVSQTEDVKFSWNDFYLNLSLAGLQESSFFKSEIATFIKDPQTGENKPTDIKNQMKLNYYNQYQTYANYLRK